MSEIPRLLTVRQFSEAHPAFPVSNLRWLRFNESKNGYAAAFVTVGRRLLIDEAEFFRIVREQNRRTSTSDPGPEAGHAQ